MKKLISVLFLCVAVGHVSMAQNSMVNRSGKTVKRMAKAEKALQGDEEDRFFTAYQYYMQAYMDNYADTGLLVLAAKALNKQWSVVTEKNKNRWHSSLYAFTDVKKSEDHYPLALNNSVNDFLKKDTTQSSIYLAAALYKMCNGNSNSTWTLNDAGSYIEKARKLGNASPEELSSLQYVYDQYAARLAKENAAGMELYRLKGLANRIITAADSFVKAPPLNNPVYFGEQPSKGVRTDPNSYLVDYSTGHSRFEALFDGHVFNSKDRDLVLALFSYKNWPPVFAAALAPGKDYNTQRNVVDLLAYYQCYEIARWDHSSQVRKNELVMLYVPYEKNAHLTGDLKIPTQNGFFLLTEHFFKNQLSHGSVNEETLARLRRENAEMDAYEKQVAANKDNPKPKQVLYMWWSVQHMSYPTSYWNVDYAYVTGPEGLSQAAVKSVIRLPKIRIGFAVEKEGFQVCGNEAQCARDIKKVHTSASSPTFLGSFEYR